MNEISNKIIAFLEQHNNWTTSKELSTEFQLSTRTIKKYISDINISSPNLIESSRQGYRINSQILNNLRTELNQNNIIPQTPEERLNYILKTLLIKKHSQNQANIYDFMNELYVSESTFRADCQKINNICEKYNCSLQISKDIVRINGSEKNKRKILNSYIVNESQNHFGDEQFLKGLFPNLDFTFIKQTIQSTFEEHHYFMNDFSLSNFVRHVAITINRIQNGCKQNHTDQQIDTTSNEYKIAKDLSSKFESFFDIFFTYTEIYELALLIICRGNSINTTKSTKSEVASFVGDELIDFVTQLCQKTKTLFAIYLDTPEFIDRFSIHLHNLLIRNDNDLLNNNPLKNKIKIQCPFIYEVAVYIANQIKEQYNISLNDDEITYISFHIGGILELQKSLQSKLPTILLIPEYYNLKKSLSSKIQNLFQNDLIILDIYTSIDNYLSYAPEHDLLLSSYSINHFIDKPNLYITPFLTQRDINEIRNIINVVRQRKKKENRSSYIKKIFKKEFFSIDKTYFSQIEAIDDICNILYKNKYVTSSYVDEVKEREALSSTAFGNFAIPHSLHINCLNTAIYVHIQEKPIKWGNQYINIIFLLSISDNDRAKFREIFEHITDTINSDDNLPKIRKVKTYEDLIDIFINA